ncbi:MAG: hypothetical protein J6S21_08055, partial [Victivallales bacterium]|nr:hypothetical protein [Victivallales bacterium]
MHDNLRQYRPIPFFFLNTTEPQELSLASARKIMGRMQEAGYGGALLFNKPPTGFSQELYLSQAWYDALENFCIAAKEAGLVIWINDGWDYPPGDAGGRILEEAPELIQYHLEQAADGTVQTVKTDWGFPAFEEPRSSELFHKYVYEGLKTHLGKYFGDPIVGIFSDADNRRINAHVQRKLPTHLYYPWSRSLPELFRSRFGYELTPHLAEILASADSQAAADYWQLTSELYQKWFAENHRWCSENGLLYSFHTSDTGPLPPEICRRSSAFSEGETLKLAAFCDYPGTDHELFALDGGTHYDARYFVPEVSRGGSADRWHHPDFANTLFDARAKIVSSAAWLYGRGRTLCEAFAATNWEATPEKLRRIAAWQIMQGINFFVPHAVHVKLHGTTKFFAPPEFLHAFPMAALRSFNDFLAKYSMIAAQGEYRPRLALLDPTPELWRGRGPGKFFQLFDRLNRHAVDYVITDRENADRFERVINPLDAGADVELPAPYASFTGGEVAFHRRFLPDGTSFILVANIWSRRTLSGILNYDGRSAEVELAPGEIAVFGGPYEEFRSPAAAPVRTQPLPLKWHAQWHEPQRVAFTEGFCWENREELPGLMLLVPGDGSACVSVNGTPLSNGTGTLVFDDVYTAYP